MQQATSDKGDVPNLLNLLTHHHLGEVYHRHSELDNGLIYTWANFRV